ncbi:MAG: hypothetical protein K6G16_11315 [Lachnospiraceae bacterium]|nr:hypothetical protein [Lachnospiraceae bacterium]
MAGGKKKKTQKEQKSVMDILSESVVPGMPTDEDIADDMEMIVEEQKAIDEEIYQAFSDRMMELLSGTDKAIDEPQMRALYGEYVEFYGQVSQDPELMKDAGGHALNPDSQEANNKISALWVEHLQEKGFLPPPPLQEEKKVTPLQPQVVDSQVPSLEQEAYQNFADWMKGLDLRDHGFPTIKDSDQEKKLIGELWPEYQEFQKKTMQDKSLMVDDHGTALEPDSPAAAEKIGDLWEKHLQEKGVVAPKQTAEEKKQVDEVDPDFAKWMRSLNPHDEIGMPYVPNSPEQKEVIQGLWQEYQEFYEKARQDKTLLVDSEGKALEPDSLEGSKKISDQWEKHLQEKGVIDPPSPAKEKTQTKDAPPPPAQGGGQDAPPPPPAQGDKKDTPAKDPFAAFKAMDPEAKKNTAYAMRSLGDAVYHSGAAYGGLGPAHRVADPDGKAGLYAAAFMKSVAAAGDDPNKLAVTTKAAKGYFDYLDRFSKVCDQQLKDIQLVQDGAMSQEDYRKKYRNRANWNRPIEQDRALVQQMKTVAVQMKGNMIGTCIPTEMTGQELQDHLAANAKRNEPFRKIREQEEKERKAAVGRFQEGVTKPFARNYLLADQRAAQANLQALDATRRMLATRSVAREKLGKSGLGKHEAAVNAEYQKGLKDMLTAANKYRELATMDTSKMNDKQLAAYQKAMRQANLDMRKSAEKFMKMKEAHRGRDTIYDSRAAIGSHPMFHREQGDPEYQFAKSMLAVARQNDRTADRERTTLKAGFNQDRARFQQVQDQRMYEMRREYLIQAGVIKETPYQKQQRELQQRQAQQIQQQRMTRPGQVVQQGQVIQPGQPLRPGMVIAPPPQTMTPQAQAMQAQTVYRQTTMQYQTAQATVQQLQVQMLQAQQQLAIAEAARQQARANFLSAQIQLVQMGMQPIQPGMQMQAGMQPMQPGMQMMQPGMPQMQAGPRPVQAGPQTPAAPQQSIPKPPPAPTAPQPPKKPVGAEPIDAQALNDQYRKLKRVEPPKPKKPMSAEEWRKIQQEKKAAQAQSPSKQQGMGPK